MINVTVWPSKNGNVLLNVVLRPDGSLDPEAETMLHELADWTAVNGEAIYGSRPWLIYGEGSAKVGKRPKFVPPAAGASAGHLLGDCLGLGTAGSGKAGRGQLGGLFGGRMVR